jgi:hypothetical protein
LLLKNGASKINLLAKNVEKLYSKCIDKYCKAKIRFFKELDCMSVSNFVILQFI